MIRTSTFNTSSQLQSSNQTMQKSASIKIMWPGAWAGAQAPWVPRVLAWAPAAGARKVFFFVSGFLACFFLFFFCFFCSLCFYRKSTSRARFPKPRKKTKRKNKPKNQKQKKIITKKNTPFLADRWGTPQSARTNGPAEMGFRDGENGFNAKKSAYASMKLYRLFY